MTTEMERPSEPIDEMTPRTRERVDPHLENIAERLIRAYQATISRRDLDDRTASDMYGAALAHLQLARRRPAGTPVVRIYDPTLADDGWQSPRTVIDLVVDDSPFIVASLIATIERAGMDVHRLIHPVLTVRRDGGELVDPNDAGGVEVSESFVHVETTGIAAHHQVDELHAAIIDTLTAVREAVSDWRLMAERAASLADQLEARSIDGSDDAADAAELLRWMEAEHFIFLGARDYELDPNEGVIRSVPDTGLGLLRNRQPSTRALSGLAPAGAARVLSDSILLITKTNSRSPVHRNDAMDYIGVRHHDPITRLITERRFIGLFTARAYSESVTRLPVVRRKVATITQRANFAPGSHDANRLVNILEDHPRDELFQASVDELMPTILAIAHLYERNQLRLFVRQDSFGRFVSCLVFVPRDRFRTEVREAIQEMLEVAYGGVGTHFDVALSSSSLARLHLIVTTPERTGPIDLQALEDRLERATRTWADHLTRLLVEQHGDGRGAELAAQWNDAFPAGYREERTPERAIDDIEHLERLAGETDGTLAVRSYLDPEADDGVLNVKLYRYGEPVRLSMVLPLLQDHGVAVLDEHPYQVVRADGREAWIHDFGMALPRPAAENLREHGPVIRSRLEDSLLAAWTGRTESDHLAELVLLAGVTWREVSVIRALAHCLRQIGTTFTPAYIQEVTTNHAGITRLLIDRFHLRLDPERLDPALDAELARWVLDALDSVSRLDEDRILRGLHSLVEATVRTNFYQLDDTGRQPDHLVFKFDPSLLPDLPAPRPVHELFVASPRVEGVHLRAGRVARGGIRWSDRREDYRTEILALMKAQVVKNSVIVPVGAKGGFVCRQIRPDDGPDTIRAEVEACYRIFIGGLLDVTDNLVDGHLVPPKGVVRRDGGDPYLVVAADRGTATFSDLANSIAVDRDFWLGDAFASGGSTGYDHKEMGITARGAWVSVRRHLAEAGIDADLDPITVVGIGDMSGDVFGNGMLLSRRLRLVAAFDDRHVFLDPDPDVDRSWQERRRLFERPGSSWADYDRSVLSPSGTVIPRSAKAVNIDDRIAAALGCRAGLMTPNDLISAILQAPVDLLWNGGIGTYVKASSERNDDVGDRANDSVRIDADELRCRTVGEGGNLGFTQRARIQASLGGVRLNTDAVDNSGGVNCSDREVNLKILLDRLVDAGALTLDERNELLLTMTDEVAELVLADSAAQVRALASASSLAPGMTHVHARLLTWLERVGGLDRQLEALPTDEQLSARATEGIGMTQPELAVLMAYTKNVIAREILDSGLPDDPEMPAQLDHYFPAAVSERFPRALDVHPLRRELIATQVTNRLVNRGGITMTLRLIEETAASVAEIARANLAAWAILDLDRTWDEIEALGSETPPAIVTEMSLSTKALAERATRWLIRNRHSPLDLSEVVAELRPAVREVLTILPSVASGSTGEAAIELHDRWFASGVPEPLATEVSFNRLASTALDIVVAARAEGAPIDLATHIYYLIDDHLGLGWLRSQIDALPRTDKWTTLARTALRDDLFHEHAELVRRILSTGGHEGAGPRVERWVAENREAIDRTFDVLLGIRSSASPEFEHLSVGLREIRNLMRRATTSPTFPKSG